VPKVSKGGAQGACRPAGGVPSARTVMQNRVIATLILLYALGVPAAVGLEPEQARVFVGQDLHIKGARLVSHRLPAGEHVLVVRDGFTMSIGANEFSSVDAVVWLQSLASEFAGGKGRPGYKGIVYLEGGVSVSKGIGARTTDLHEKAIEAGGMVVWFGVSGDVFVTAEERKVEDPTETELYKRGVVALREVGIGDSIVRAAGLEPRPRPEEPEPEKPAVEPTVVTPPEPRFRYPINLSPAGRVKPRLESAKGPDGTDVATVIGRFYISQKQDEKGGLLELQADCAVIFFGAGNPPSDQNQPEELLARGAVEGIYLAGDVLMTNGQRTIRADEIYYDFLRTKAIVRNGEMRNFSVKDGIPVYVRAAELRQLSANEFTARDVTLTTSEFHEPQISLDASRLELTDTTAADQQEGRTTKTSYEAGLHDVRFNVYGLTIFRWPYLRTNLERPDTALKSAHAGHSSRWGWLLETRWYMARLLGLREPEGTDSTFALDYYSKRGTGVGIDIEYARENYFGKILGYIINDHGKDRLGRHATRKNLEPSRDLRGRFRWQHRQFLAYNWQLTGEISYSSDLNFIESFYRNEFYVGKEQETLVHLKRIEDNWGLSFLGKIRINDFVNKLEELPTAEFHWTGQSFWDDRLTFYSDTQVSRFRQRYASSNKTPGPQQFFTFATTRNEVDMPLSVGKMKVVPFIAGTAAYEDRMGFYREIDGGTGAREDDVYYGEVGVRVSGRPLWRVFPEARSRLWDVDRLRHVVRPYLTAVSYAQDKSVIAQRDVINLGLSQRLQTKRGPAGKKRTVDWMRLNTDVTWVNDSGGASAGADRFIWNKPFIPVVNTYSSVVPQLDRRSSIMSGVRRNYVGAEYSWRLSDTTTLLSDMNFDMQSGVVQQLNFGFSHMRWPNLNYYIGSRYLRRITILDPSTSLAMQKGSNAFVFAVTYILDPRYSVVFSQEVDFDYGATVCSELTLIRRYHRMYWGLSYRADESLDEQGIVFSIWPQGVPELGVGPRRYMRMGEPAEGY